MSSSSSCVGGKRDSLIKLAVNELHQNLHALKLVVVGEFNGPLRMLEVECLIRIRSPIPQAFEVKLRANVLKQNSHHLPRVFVGTVPSVVADIGRARRNALYGYPEYYGTVG
jgi:hypothetical protein